MRVTLGQLRSRLVEAMDADESEDAYEAAKQSMVPVDRAQYRAIYQRLHDKLSAYETFTNPEANAQFGERHIYTLWGLRDEETPVISMRERDGEFTFKANPRFLATKTDPEGF